MKIQRTPLILLAIAALLGSVVVVLETQRNQPSEVAQTSQKLFPFEEADVQAFTLTTPIYTRSFVKTVPAAGAKSASPSPTPATKAGVWQMTEPQAAIASDGAIAFLLNLLGTSRSEKTVTVPTAQLAEFGLAQPQAIVEVTLQNQKKHRLVLGNPDFNRSFLYAQVDPPASPTPEQTIHLVSLDFETAVNRPVEEWLQQAADRPQPLPPAPKP